MSKYSLHKTLPDGEVINTGYTANTLAEVRTVTKELITKSGGRSQLRFKEAYALMFHEDPYTYTWFRNSDVSYIGQKNLTPKRISITKANKESHDRFFKEIRRKRKDTNGSKWFNNLEN